MFSAVGPVITITGFFDGLALPSLWQGSFFVIASTAKQSQFVIPVKQDKLLLFALCRFGIHFCLIADCTDFLSLRRSKYLSA